MLVEVMTITPPLGTPLVALSVNEAARQSAKINTADDRQ
jgi:hypothetical protein